MTSDSISSDPIPLAEVDAYLRLIPDPVRNLIVHAATNVTLGLHDIGPVPAGTAQNERLEQFLEACDAHGVTSITVITGRDRNVFLKPDRAGAIRFLSDTF